MPARTTRSSAAKAATSVPDSVPKSQVKNSDRSRASKAKSSPKANSVPSGANASTPATPANSSRKRARAVIKEEDIKDEPESTPTPPSKRARQSSKTSTGKKNTSKSKATSKTKPKPELDLEAGAKLASSMTAATPQTTPSKTKSNPYNLSPGESPYPSYPHPTPAACRDVHDRLAAVHGTRSAPSTIPAPNLQSSGCGEVPSVLDALVRTRLSANTNNANSNRAFQGLVQRFGIVKEGVGKGSVDWEAVRQADVGDVFEAIKHGGLANVKSRDIKAILDLVHKENVEMAKAQKEDEGYEAQMVKSGVLSLDHLHSMATDDAFQKLLAYPGIGPKTASCVLLFCMQRPSFAVDTHVFRLTRWLGWTPSDAEVRRMGKEMREDEVKSPRARGPPPVSRNTTYAHLDVRIPDDLKYPLHYLLIKHGKTCPSCMAKRDSKVKEAWGTKPCPIKDLKQGSRKQIKKEVGEDIADDEEEDDDEEELDEDIDEEDEE